MVARLVVLAACLSAAIANPWGGFYAGELVGAPAYGLNGYGYGDGLGYGYGHGHGVIAPAVEVLPTAVTPANPILIQVPPPAAPLVPGFPALGPSIANAAVPACGGPIASATTVPTSSALLGAKDIGYGHGYGNLGLGLSGAAPIAAYNEIAPVISGYGYGNGWGNGYGNGYGYGLAPYNEIAPVIAAPSVLGYGGYGWGYGH